MREPQTLFVNTGIDPFKQSNRDKGKEIDVFEEAADPSQLQLVGANRVPAVKKKIPVKEILFAQKDVSPLFSDGTPLAQVSQALQRKIISPESIPSIRVVASNGDWWALDNRRLRVFKDAQVEEIVVEICDLSNPEIKKEFELKKTNKFADQSGGIVRRSSKLMNSTRQGNKHFDEGNFIFTKEVLSWSVSHLESALPVLKHSSPLPVIFFDKETYYGSFKNLILEEARAILHEGNRMGTLPYQGELIRSRLSRNFNNPCTITFKIDDHRALFKPADMFILTQGHCNLLAMASYNEYREGNLFPFKAVISKDYRGIYLEAKTPSQPKSWHIKPIGSVITQLRIYEACCAKTSLAFGQALFNPRSYENYQWFSPQPEMLPVMLDGVAPAPSFFSSVSVEESATKKIDQDLNPSQQEAIEKFLNLDTGLQLIQGPPGTGKTTTLLALLKKLFVSEQRILVSAPSNKAIHILAQRFIQACPDASVILIGTEDHFSEFNLSIQNISLDFRLRDVQKKLQDQVAELLVRIEKSQSKPDILPNESVARNEVLLNVQHDLSKIKMLKHQANNLSSIAEFEDCLKDIALLIDSLPSLLDELSNILYRIQSVINKSLSDKIELQLLKNAYIIFATLSSSGRKVVKDISPIDVLIIDEAGQAVEAETLIPMQLKPKKCLLAGDTKQLPATVSSEAAKKLKYDRSLMGRLVEDCNYTYSLLDTQHRMHPEIRLWPNKQYYDSQLKDAESVMASKYNPSDQVPVYLQRYSFIAVKGKECFSNKSFINRAEVSAITVILKELRGCYSITDNSQVGIITFYKAQANLLKEQLSSAHQGIRIHTVDGFQGGECDFIFISFVRANPRGKIGFLEDFRRLNVALTRARYGLFMFGDIETLKKCDHDIKELLEDARTRNKIFFYEDIAKHVSNSPSSSEYRGTFFNSHIPHDKKLVAHSERYSNDQQQHSNQDTPYVSRDFSKKRRIYLSSKEKKTHSTSRRVNDETVTVTLDFSSSAKRVSIKDSPPSRVSAFGSQPVSSKNFNLRSYSNEKKADKKPSVSLGRSKRKRKRSGNNNFTK